MTPPPSNISRRQFTVSIKGRTLEVDFLDAITVDQDLGQPDMCVISLNRNGYDVAEKAALADSLEIKTAGQDGGTVFKGEAVGVEAKYHGRGDSKFMVRGFNRLHRLSRGRNSKTYLKMTDKSIVSQVAQANGLSAHCGSSPSITHEYVYQHNQTDLEFLRLRAARLGFDVWVEDKTLHFEAPRTDADSGITLQIDDPTKHYFTKSFTPRLASAQLVDKVEVHGWDPVKKEKIVGKASAGSSRMGRKVGAKQAKAFGSKTTYEVEYPIFSKQEADAIAKARLAEMSMDYIIAEAVCIGDAKLAPGKIVKVDLPKLGGKASRFSGKYLIVGACHRYAHASAHGGGGYTTELRLRRDAEGDA